MSGSGISRIPDLKKVITVDPSDNSREAELDNKFKIPIVIDVAHHEVHEGDHYFVKGFQDGAIDFLWVVPNTTKRPHSLWSISAEGEFELKLYETVVTSNDGAAVSPINSDRNSGNTAGVAAFSGPTLNSGALGDSGDGGDLIWAGKVGSSRTATIGRSTEGEFIGKQNTKYWFEIAQIAGGTLWVDWLFHWYEHTDE